MKPFQVALLVIAGGVGGAVVMKIMQRPAAVVAPAAPAPVVAQNSTPAPQAEPAAPPPETKPEPFVEKKRPREKKNVIARDPEPIARNTPPPDSAPAPVAAPAPPAPVEVPPPAPEPESAPSPPPPPPPQVTLNAGLNIPVRLIDGLSTERTNAGDGFTGTLDGPLVVDGLVIAERGARVEGRVVSSDKGGKVKGVAFLSIQLTRIHLSDGQTISVRTDPYERHAEASHGTDAEKVGAGAAIGAIIGAIAGGGKGAAVGAGVGGGAGAGDVMLTRGKPATIASETKITFRLAAPLTVTERQR